METDAPKAPTKFCFACGKTIDARAEICPHCGVRQHAPPAPPLLATTPGGKNRLVAILFAICLGGLGIHKFYLGQVGLGILYLVFFWTVIPAVVGVIEGIYYLTLTDDEFARRYG